jgi:hypothetical protein
MYTRSSAGHPQWIGGPTSRSTKEEVREALVRCNGIQSHAAAYLGCSYWTIRKYCERCPELRTVAEEAREILIDKAEARLYDLVDNGEFGPVRFVLETLGRSRGYVKQMNLAGHNGSAIQVEHSAREMLEAKLRAMNERVVAHAGDEDA